MKTRYYKGIGALAMAGVLFLSSCLKDSRYTDFTKVGLLVELPLDAKNGAGNLTPEAFTISSTPTVLETIVNEASPVQLSTALPVTFFVDTAQITAYNNANGLTVADGTAYSLLPAADYSIPSYSVTIPANARTAIFKISINTSAIDPSGLFILPISIKDASGQKISNYKTLLYNVQAKNQFDGQYIVNGTLTDNDVPTDVGNYPEDIDLITQGATTVGFYDVSNGYFHEINTTTGVGVYGSFAPVFTIVGGKVTAVTNYYGQHSGPHGRSARLDTSTGATNITINNPGDTGSKPFEIDVWYVMVQDDYGGDRTFFKEKMVYQGPR